MNPDAETFGVDRGIGVERDIFASGIPRTFKQDERDRPSAIVRLVGPPVPWVRG